MKQVILSLIASVVFASPVTAATLTIEGFSGNQAPAYSEGDYIFKAIGTMPSPPQLAAIRIGVPSTMIASYAFFGPAATLERIDGGAFTLSSFDTVIASWVGPPNGDVNTRHFSTVTLDGVVNSISIQLLSPNGNVPGSIFSIDVSANAAFQNIVRFSWSNQFGSSGMFYDNFVTKAAVAAVPEPASWALTIAGFGLVGSAMRRREAQVKRSKCSVNPV